MLKIKKIFTILLSICIITSTYVTTFATEINTPVEEVPPVTDVVYVYVMDNGWASQDGNITKIEETLGLAEKQTPTPPEGQAPLSWYPVGTFEVSQDTLAQIMADSGLDATEWDNVMQDLMEQNLDTTTRLYVEGNKNNNVAEYLESVRTFGTGRGETRLQQEPGGSNGFDVSGTEAPYWHLDICMDSHEITYLQESGEVLASGEYLYGYEPEHAAIETPTKDSTVEHNYEFKEWTPTEDSETGNITYKPIYTESIRKYTVIWQNENGEILKTEEVEYGATPSYGGEAPIKVSDSQYDYAFSGWGEIAPVSGDVTYTAAFTATEISAPAPIIPSEPEPIIPESTVVHIESEPEVVPPTEPEIIPSPVPTPEPEPAPTPEPEIIPTPVPEPTEPETEIIEEEETPLASQIEIPPIVIQNNEWSIVNLTLTLLCVFSSIWMLIFSRNKTILNLLTVFPAVGAIIMLAVTQSLRGPMIFINEWTLTMVSISLIQADVCYIVRNKGKDKYAILEGEV